jgi:hypothetical protein
MMVRVEHILTRDKSEATDPDVTRATTNTGAAYSHEIGETAR